MTDADRQAFGARLTRLIRAKGLRASDVARQMFGEETTPSGTAAKGRDRLSVWMRGIAMPDALNLSRLAAALGVSVDELAQPAPTGDRFSITATGTPGMVMLEIRQALPLGLALRIAQLLEEAPR